MVIKIMHLHSSQTILVFNYIISLFLFMKDWPVFFTEPLNVLLGKKFLEEKKRKLKEREFLQLFVETLPNKLSSLPKKDNK